MSGRDATAANTSSATATMHCLSGHANTFFQTVIVQYALPWLHGLCSMYQFIGPRQEWLACIHVYIVT